MFVLRFELMKNAKIVHVQNEYVDNFTGRKSLRKIKNRIEYSND